VTRSGSLTVVGTGIAVAGQVTLEALDHLRRAERLLYLAGDESAARWIKKLNPAAESLWLYREGQARAKTYREMTERILKPLREQRRVVAAFYGHPGVGVHPAHAAIRQARREGYPARMLPGISAEACLVAELGIDPLETGWQSYEAWRFLTSRPRFDPGAALILWQLGLIYQHSVDFSRRSDPKGLGDLARTLKAAYPPTHRVMLYEASPFPLCASRIERRTLRNLPTATIRTSTTLYVPPLR
jgi:precorrin-6B methylase 1